MEVRIGIQQSPRELSFESGETAQDVQALFTKALTANEPIFSLVDTKGNTYIVQTAAVTYIEVGGDSSRRVGFVN